MRVGERCVWYWLAIGRETLRSMWTVSKLRTHSAVTPTVISRRVQVGEQIAGAKWAVKRAIQDADQHDRSEQYAQQQTPDQRRHVNGAAAADDMPTCGAGTVRPSDIHRPYSTGEAPWLRPYRFRPICSTALYRRGYDDLLA